MNRKLKVVLSLLGLYYITTFFRNLYLNVKFKSPSWQQNPILCALACLAWPIMGLMRARTEGFKWDYVAKPKVGYVWQSLQNEDLIKLLQVLGIDEDAAAEAVARRDEPYYMETINNAIKGA